MKLRLIGCLSERDDLLNFNEIGILKVLIDNKFAQILRAVLEYKCIM